MVINNRSVGEWSLAGPEQPSPFGLSKEVDCGFRITTRVGHYYYVMKNEIVFLRNYHLADRHR
jgi:hypothetical protein